MTEIHDNILFRTLMPDEAPLLADISRRTFLDTFPDLYTPEDLRDYFAKAYDECRLEEEIARSDMLIRVVEMDGEMMGYMKVGPNKLPVENPAEPAFEIWQFYLMPPAKGKGISDHLMWEALTFCQEKGAASVYLGVWENNPRAQKFYARHGFKQVGTYYFEVGHQKDLEYILQWQGSPEALASGSSLLL